MSDLADLVDGLKRELAVPGEFATTFANTTDDDLTGALADAFAGAQLDGFFSDQVLDPNAQTVTPDLSVSGGALVVLYASERILTAKLRTIPTRVVYDAGGGTKYEKDQSANVMVQELKMISDRKKQLLAQALRLSRARSGTYMTDAYVTRALGYYSALLNGEWGGFFPYELVGVPASSGY
jgi:hypothetical protein